MKNLRNIIILGIIAVVVLAVLFFTTEKAIMPVVENDEVNTIDNPAPVLSAKDRQVMNAGYIFPEQTITLRDGNYQSSAPNFAEVNVFGQPVYSDLDNDGDEDGVIFLTWQTAGTGVFYYVAAAVDNGKDWQGTNVILLGDRIAPQNINFQREIIMVNYADRKIDEPMTTSPSVGQTKYLKLENGVLQLANALDDLITVDLPTPGSVVSSPLAFSGQARGTWFFEASFPVVLVDWDGKIIGQGIAQAQGEWMTEDYVPFSGSLEFTMPDYGERGALIFQKDNPSGLPQYDKALEMGIYFK